MNGGHILGQFYFLEILCHLKRTHFIRLHLLVLVLITITAYM